MINLLLYNGTTREYITTVQTEAFPPVGSVVTWTKGNITVSGVAQSYTVEWFETENVPVPGQYARYSLTVASVVTSEATDRQDSVNLQS